MSIKVIVNGANGRMGQEAIIALNADPRFELVAQTGRADDLASIIKETNADVVVDLTTADSVFENAKTIITAGAHPVIGTSGLQPEEFMTLKQLAAEKNLGGIVVPNFSIGAVLMMRYARDAAKYLPDVEIIEMHHDGKLDAPSGTAIKTAELIHETRKSLPEQKQLRETITGSRGAEKHGVHIHAVRLPGLVAHQQVLFGGNAETLTIRHDSMHRSSFMPGLLLACEKVGDFHQLMYGLENLLD